MQKGTRKKKEKKKRNHDLRNWEIISMFCGLVNNSLFVFSFPERPQSPCPLYASLLSWDVVLASHVKSRSVRGSPDGHVSTSHTDIPREQVGIHEVT